MAKRFTDTEKWKKPFIKKLPLKYKLLWFYILDDCNHAGIWDIDLEIASLRISAKFLKEDCEKALKDKIQVFDNGEKWFIKDFIDFQYGELSEKNRAHKSVLLLLNKYNLAFVNKPLISPLQGAKDKDKDKYKDKDKDIRVNKSKIDKVLSIFNESDFNRTIETLKTNKDEIRKRLFEFLEVEALTPTFENKQIGEILKHFRNWLNYNKPLEIVKKTKAPWLGNN